MQYGELVVNEIDVQVVSELDIGKLTEGWPKPEDPEEPIKEFKIRWYMTDQEIADLQEMMIFVRNCYLRDKMEKENQGIATS